MIFCQTCLPLLTIVITFEHTEIYLPLLPKPLFSFLILLLALAEDFSPSSFFRLLLLRFLLRFLLRVIAGGVVRVAGAVCTRRRVRVRG